MTVIQYIRSQYKQSNTTSFNSIPLLNRFGEEGRNQLNDLKKQGIIKRVNGANQIIVEYLPEKDTEHDID